MSKGMTTGRRRLSLMDREASNKSAPLVRFTPLAAGLLVIGLVVGAGISYFAIPPHSVTTTTLSTTSVSTYVPSGSQTLLSSAVEVIPSGLSSIAVPSSAWSLPYNGYLEVSYTSQNDVQLAYFYGTTLISTPSSETASNLLVPVLSGNFQLSVVNDACSPSGCPSDTMTISVTYFYGTLTSTITAATINGTFTQTLTITRTITVHTTVTSFTGP